VWCDGKPLQVAAPSGSPDDRVADHVRIGRDPEPRRRRGAERFVEARAVEPPERREGSAVHGEHGRAVGAPGAAQGRRGHRRQAAEVVGEQVQSLADREPRGEEAVEVGGRERGGDDFVVPAPGEHLEAPAHAVRGRRRRVGEGSDVRHPLVAPPRPDAQPVGAQAQHVHAPLSHPRRG
jgi:hypothetical protein